MGISIQYRGSLDNKLAIYELIKEVAEIAKTLNWECEILDQEWKSIPTARFESTKDGGIQIVGNTCLKGVQFIPHAKCEPIWLFFTMAGNMSTPFHVALDAEDLYPERKVWITSITHYAGADIHISILNLFKHLKKKYISDLEVHDEGGYWETGDKSLLEFKIQKLDRLMAMSDEQLWKAVQEKDYRNNENDD